VNNYSYTSTYPTLTPTPLFIEEPRTTIKVAAGKTAPYLDPSTNVTWSTDQNYSSTTTIYSTTSSIKDTNSDGLYQTERYGLAFTYNFNMYPGTYKVTLKFAEIFQTEKGQRIFDVSINGDKVLSKFDIFAEAGANTALDKTFTITTDGPITISFRTIKDNAKISAIQIDPVSIITPTKAPFPSGLPIR
jgi:hypothetical protein